MKMIDDPYQGEYEQDANEEPLPQQAIREEYKEERKFISPMRLNRVARKSSSGAKHPAPQNLPSFKKASPKAKRGYISPFDKFIKE